MVRCPLCGSYDVDECINGDWYEFICNKCYTQWIDKDGELIIL